MAFHAGDLVATIRLDGMQTFERDTARAGQSLSKAGGLGEKAGQAIRHGMQVAAVGITASTVAATAYVTSLMRTGAAYNTLQQTSRAALKTMLGGAEAAADQMAKLDDFARNSPFSKAVFIQAQQQMLGFGIEASKVVPYLDAIQDAVAATGGSSGQVGEIAQILSKIAGQSRITGEELLQLGGRGIDAAGMIGESLGMSVEEVRKAISKNTIDAHTALDALAEGMKRSYGGAAAEVKKTWSGTVDRISAAQREIGAALAEPFISQQGGGLAITWGNQVADVLRSILIHVAPITQMLSSRLMPTFARMTEALDTARVVIRSWDSSKIEAFLDKARSFGPAVAVLGGALAGLTNSGLRSMLGPLGAIIPQFGLLGGAIGALVLGTEDGRRALADLLGAFEPLLPVVAELAGMVAEGLNMALPVAADLISGLSRAITPLLSMITAIPAPVVALVAAFVGMQGALRGMQPLLQGAVDGFRRIGEQMAVQRALGAMEGQTTRLSGAFGVAGTAVTGLGNSIKAAFLTNPIGVILMGVSLAIAGITAAFAAHAERTAEATARIADYKATLDDLTGATTSATRAVLEKNIADKDMLDNLDSARLTRDTYVRALMGEEAAQKRVNAVLAEAQSHLRVMNGEQGESLNMFDESNRMLVELAENYNETNSEIAKGAEEKRRDAREARDAAQAMTDMARSNARMNDALAIARDVAADATSRLNALKQALDELNGGAKTAADVEQELNDKTRSLADAFNVTNEEGVKLADSLVKVDGAIDTKSGAGSALKNQIDGLRDAYLAAIQVADKAAKLRGDEGVSIEEAVRIHAEYAEVLRTTATEAGVADEKIGAMVSAALDMPQVVSFLLSDDGSIDTKRQELLVLAQQIIETPNGNFEIHENDIDGLMEALRLLGVDITTIPVGQVKVTKDDGSFIFVEGELRKLTETRTAMIKAQIQQSVELTENRGRSTMRAHGGPVFGPGTETSDSIHALLSHNEHVLTAREVRGLGGHSAVAALRQRARDGLLGFADGGPVTRMPVTAAHLQVPVTVPVAVGSGAGDLEGLVTRMANEIVGALYERPPVQITEINPVHRKPLSEAWENAKGGGL